MGTSVSLHQASSKDCGCDIERKAICWGAYHVVPNCATWHITFSSVYWIKI